MHKSLLSAAALALAVVAPLAHAHTEGDIIVRAGAITVNPKADSSSVKVDQGPLAGADLGGKATMSRIASCKPVPWFTTAMPRT